MQRGLGQGCPSVGAAGPRAPTASPTRPHRRRRNHRRGIRSNPLVCMERALHCLASGSWSPVDNATWDAHSHGSGCDGCIRAKKKRVRPKDPCASIAVTAPPRHKWTCGGDAALSRYQGVFSDAKQPVEIIVIGDSMADQVAAALGSARGENRHLSHLSVKYVRALSAIPRSVEGCLRVLEDATGSFEMRRGAKRFLVAGAGTWYGLLTPCGPWRLQRGGLQPRRSSDAACQYSKESCARALNHSSPADTKLSFRHFGHGNYAMGRLCAGTLTVEQYPSDVALLLTAVSRWQRASRSRFLWFEAPPQHYSPRLRGACSDAPGPHVPSAELAGGTGAAARAVLPRAAATLCGGNAAETTLAECASPDALAQWRSAVLAPVLRSARVRVVPLAAALSTRASDHPGAGAESLDCTHWCEGSSATLHMASAVLAVAAAALVDGDALRVRFGATSFSTAYNPERT